MIIGLYRKRRENRPPSHDEFDALERILEEQARRPDLYSAWQKKVSAGMSIRPLPKALLALIRAQDFRCAYCRKAFLLNGNRRSSRSPTFEHVRPRSKGHSRIGNVVAVHRRCNEAKGDRLPTGCELLVLEIVNVKRAAA